MAVNVKGKNGEHLGFVYSYDRDLDCFLVALSNNILEDTKINYQQIDRIVAKDNGLLTWNGKVKEEQYRDFLTNTKILYADIEEELYLTYYDTELNFFKKLLFLIALKSDYTNPSLMDIYNSHQISDAYEGYVLFNLGELKHDGESLILVDEMNYIEPPVLTGCKPIFGEIAGIPVVRQENLFLKEVDHYHYTDILVRSGNVTRGINMRASVYCKKGMHVQFAGTTNDELYCDGIIYQVQ